MTILGTRRAGLLLFLAAAVMGCPFSTVGLDTGSSGDTTSTSSSTSSSSGTGGNMGCKAGETQSCYGGMMNVAGVGECKLGTQECQSDGTFGPCVGWVGPQTLENCATELDQNCDGKVVKCSGVLNGGLTVGSSTEDLAYGVAIDSQGNAIVTGYFHGSGTDFGGKPLSTANGGTDAFVVKYDPFGKVIWAHAIGGNGDDIGTAVTVDAMNNIYITGTFAVGLSYPMSTMFTGDYGIYVAKLDKDGTPLWAQAYAGTKDARRTKAIAVDATGRVAVVGVTTGTITFGATSVATAGLGDPDGFVVLFDQNGMLQWVRQVKDITLLPQSLEGVAFNKSGDIVVSGYGSGDIDVGGPAPIPTSGVGKNVLLAAYHSDGTYAWGKVTGDAFEQLGAGLAADSGGTVFATGSFAGVINLGGACVLTAAGAGDVYVAALDTTGTPSWCKHFGSMNQASGIAVATDGDGVVVSGAFNGPLPVGTSVLMPKGGQDAFVLKLAAKDGAELWAQSLGGSGDEIAWGVAVTQLGASVVVGEFTSDIGLGAGSVPSKGQKDVFIANIGP